MIDHTQVQVQPSEQWSCDASWLSCKGGSFLEKRLLVDLPVIVYLTSIWELQHLQDGKCQLPLMLALLLIILLSPRVSQVIIHLRPS